jgi:hypothetical protein
VAPRTSSRLANPHPISALPRTQGSADAHRCGSEHSRDLPCARTGVAAYDATRCRWWARARARLGLGLGGLARGLDQRRGGELVSTYRAAWRYGARRRGRSAVGWDRWGCGTDGWDGTRQGRKENSTSCVRARWAGREFIGDALGWCRLGWVRSWRYEVVGEQTRRGELGAGPFISQSPGSTVVTRNAGPEKASRAPHGT